MISEKLTQNKPTEREINVKSYLYCDQFIDKPGDSADEQINKDMIWAKLLSCRNAG